MVLQLQQHCPVLVDLVERMAFLELVVFMVVAVVVKMVPMVVMVDKEQ
jgi:hypothetical protein